MRVSHRVLFSVLGFDSCSQLCDYIRRHRSEIEEDTREPVEVKRQNGTNRASDYLLTEKQALSVNSLRVTRGHRSRRTSTTRFFNKERPAEKQNHEKHSHADADALIGEYPKDAVLPKTFPARISHRLMAEVFECTADALRQFIAKKRKRGELKGAFPTAETLIPETVSAHYKHYLLTEKQYLAINALRPYGFQDKVKKRIHDRFIAADLLNGDSRKSEVVFSDEKPYNPVENEQINLPLELKRDGSYITLGQFAKLIDRKVEDVISANNNAPEALQYNFELFNDGDNTPLSEKDAFVLFSILHGINYKVWEVRVSDTINAVSKAGGLDHIAAIRKKVSAVIDGLKRSPAPVLGKSAIESILLGSISLIEKDKSKAEALANVFSSEI